MNRRLGWSIVALTPLLLAASAEEDLRVLAFAIAGVMLSVLGVLMKRHFDNLNAVLDATPKIQGALYGYEDGEGKKQGGVIARVARIEADILDIRQSVHGIPALTETVERALIEARNAAEAARELHLTVITDLRRTAERHDHERHDGE